MSSTTTTAVRQTRQAVLRSTATSWFKLLMAGSVLTLLYLTAVFLLVRRLAGALNEPLPISMLILTGSGLAITAWTVRAIGQDRVNPSGTTLSRPGRLLILTAPTVAVLAVGVALSLPGSSTMELVVLWTIIAAEELGGCVLNVRKSATDSTRLLPQLLKSTRPETPRAPASHSAECEAMCDNAIFDDTTNDTGIIQRLVRRQDADGAETISGELRATFTAGQRTASVHVAFCPPFSALPNLDVEQVAGPPARVKTVQLLPYGARFDVKLAAKIAGQPQAVRLRFSAHA